MNDEDRVELNARAFVMSHELAETMAARYMIHVCLDCDPSGHDFHLDPDHRVDELLAAGARSWVPPDRSSRVALIRLPIFNEHHGSNRA